MAEAVLDREWRYPLTNVSADRSVSRAAVSGLVSELVGFDGSLRGGLRPFPGMDLAYELDFQDDANHNSTSKVLDCLPINFRRENQSYAYGFVYRVRRLYNGGAGAVAELADVFVDYYDVAAGVWRTGSDGNLIAEDVPVDGQMDVAVFGRLCYVFIEGRSPVLFYIEQPGDAEDITTGSGSVPSSSSSSGSAAPPTLRVVGRTGVPPLPGPGFKPSLLSPDAAGALGTVYSTNDPIRPAAGQVVLTNESPQQTNLFQALQDDNPFLFSDESSSLLGDPTKAHIVSVHQPTQQQFIPGVTVTATQAIMVFVSGRTEPQNIAGVSIVVTSEQDGTTVDTATAVASSLVSKADNEFTFYDERTAIGQWYIIEPSAAGTYDLRVKINATTDELDYFDEIMSAVVVDGVDPADPITTGDTLTYRATSASGLHGLNIVGMSTDEVALVGCHYFEPGSAVAGRETGVPDDALGFEFRKLTDNDSAQNANAQGHLVWGAYNESGANPATINTQFSVNPVEDRYHLVSTIHLKAGSPTIPPGSSSSAPAVDRPNRKSTNTSTNTDDISAITSAITTATGDFLLAFSYCSGTTDAEREVQVSLGGNLFLEISADSGPVDVLNDGVLLKAWYLPITSTLQTAIGGAATVQVVATDSSVTRSTIGVAVLQFEKVDLNNPWGGPFFSGNRIDDDTPSVTYSPTEDVDADLVLAGIWNDTADTGIATNTELWETAAGIGFIGDTFDVADDFSDVSLGYTLSGGTSQSDSGLIALSIRGGFGSGVEAFEDNFQVILLTPEDGKTGVGPEAVLTWTGKFNDGTPDPTDLVYDVYLGIDGETELKLIATAITEEQYDAGKAFGTGSLPYGKTLNWKVIARLSDSVGFAGVSSSTWDFTVSGDFDARQLEPGDYVFGYLLYDSRTGRQSSFSEIAQVRAEDFPPDASDPDDVDRLSRFAAMEILYDSEKFDQAYIYRSVKVQDAGGTMIARWQHLDSIIDLKKYQSVNNGDGTLLPSDQPYRQSIYYYRFEDKVLVWQQPYVDLPNYDAQMPRGGTATMYSNTLMVGKVTGGDVSTAEENRENDAFTGLGELRWSSVPQISPELFPPQNRYTPAVPSNEVIKLEGIGGNVLGFSKDRMYHIRREGNGIQVREMHEGFLGAVNHKATATAGSIVYVVTTKGIKMVDAFAKLDHVHVFDELIRENWKNSLDNVSCAYDSRASVLFFHNATEETTACIWLDTAMATELHDMPFLEVRKGAWPSDNTDLSSTLTERAFFVMNSQEDIENGVLHSGWKPRVYIMDDRRQKTITGSEFGARDGDARTTMLDVTGEVTFPIGSVQGVGRTILTLTDADSLMDSTADGATIYFLTGDLQGQKATIVKVTSSGDDKNVILKTLLNPAPAPGDVIAISPVYCKAVTGALHHLDEATQDNRANDFFEVRQLNQLGATFIDVVDAGNFGHTTGPFYRAIVYRGSQATVADSAVPTDESRSDVASIRTDEMQYKAGLGLQVGYERKQGLSGVSLSPGIETFYPDVDYRLLGIMVKGKLRPTQTRRAPSTGP